MSQGNQWRGIRERLYWIPGSFLADQELNERTATLGLLSDVVDKRENPR